MYAVWTGHYDERVNDWPHWPTNCRPIVLTACSAYSPCLNGVTHRVLNDGVGVCEAVVLGARRESSNVVFVDSIIGSSRAGL